MLSFINAPDFEAPGDSNESNVYEVVVQVSDGTLVDTQTINVTVTDVNEAPVITSDGGGSDATVFFAEGSRGVVTTVFADDFDAGAEVTYAIVGGIDSQLFTMDPATGAVTFIGQPDFEAPTDQDGDNNYDIVVQASDGTNTDFQNLRVTVTDVADGLLLTDVNGFVALNEGDPANHIDPDVTFTDSEVGYDGGNLTVTGLNSTDIVSVFNNGTSPGQIGLESGTVSYGGVDFGMIDATVPGAFVINFNADATREAIEALIEVLSYRSTSDIPIPTHALFLSVTNTLGQQTPAVAVAVQFTADILNGTADDDTLNGMRGNDVISGFDGFDNLSGDVGDDQIFGGAGDDTLDGGSEDDLLDGGEGFDTLTGGDGRDILLGGAQDDILDGQTSDDVLDGGAGDDTLDGGSEDDRLLGDTGADMLRGGDGLDRLDGGDDDDFLFAGEGDDILSGGIGVDDIKGEGGNDQLSGGGGNDRIDGGSGVDTVIFKGPFSSYTVQFITAGVVRVIGPEGDDLVFGCEFLEFDDQRIGIAGLNNEPPRIISDGGGTETAIEIVQGETLVTTVVATDANQQTTTYSIAGGADAARFTIDPATGELSFITPPDFAAPTDVGRDNTYDVLVAASDGPAANGGSSDIQAITVIVREVLNAPAPVVKDSGPEICVGPADDAGGPAGPPQVLPSVFDKVDAPPVPDDLGDMREAPDFFPQDPSGTLSFRLTDAIPLEPPPLTVRDDGFS